MAEPSSPSDPSSIRTTDHSSIQIGATDSSSSPQRLTKSSKSADDTDTCRICRGEGSSNEPLFYPCKCSGSIKFVHQECLMEWLSHSQKKHCELCKTSFRFTKLYDSSMPKKLPFLVFIRKATVHLLHALLIWLRALLVATVWLFWLPWSMRFVWWGLFWIGDGSWTADFQHLRGALDSDNPLTPLVPSPASFSRSAYKYQTPLHPSPLYTEPKNRLAWLVYIQTSLSNSTSTLVDFFSRTYSSITKSNPSIPVGGISLAAQTSPPTGPSPLPGPSLLSYISFFQNLTPNAALNKFIVDILEGQIITLAVVTAFILVFLIREWVVQQQPALNVGLGAEDELNPDAVLAARNDLNEIPPLLRNAAPDNDRPDPPAQDIPLQQDLAESLQDSTTSSSQITTDLRDISIDEIRSLVDRIRNNDILQRFNNTEDLRAPREEIQEASRLILRTRRVLKALRTVSRDALAQGNTVFARDALNKLELLQETLPFFPWRNDSERLTMIREWQDYLKPAHELLNLQEAAKSGALGPHNQNIYSQPSPSLSEAEQPASNGQISESGDPSDRQKRRPVMPGRSQSSIATSIQRELQEAVDQIHDADASSANQDRSGQHEFSEQVHHDQISLEMPTEPESPSSLLQDSDSDDHGDQQAADPSLTSDAFLHNDYSERTVFGLDDSVEIQPITINLEQEHLEEDNNDSGDRDSDDNNDTDSQDSVVHEDETGSEHLQLSLWEKFWNWTFADVGNDIVPREQEREENDEHVVEDIADEAPFVPIVDARPQNQEERRNGGQNNGHDLADAIQVGPNGNDAEPAEEAEDLEGVLELIGMQGPLASLFQNAVFCAVLISATVTSAVWFPYLCGKWVLIWLANPLLLTFTIPLQLISNGANFIIDLNLYCCAMIIHWFDYLLSRSITRLLSFVPGIRIPSTFFGFTAMTKRVAESALTRMIRTLSLAKTSSNISKQHLSLSSLTALRVVQSQARTSVSTATNLIKAVYNHVFAWRTTIPWPSNASACFQMLQSVGIFSWTSSLRSFQWLRHYIKSQGLSVTFRVKEQPAISASTLGDWTPTDRLVAVLLGYSFFAIIGALYLRRSSPFSTSEQGKLVERVITEMLQQSGGVLKVILIISIEMILFPLYCGLLLDAAMLPLFQTTLQSRLEYTISHPWTSAFVHWFLGTCYMFHFALFVSMCRKIFRNGVLYFIRDPDDPTFHPVRDVLERSVSSQLRKIGFSALVYGALVIVFMGSVIWGVAYGIHGIFPLNWTTKSPFLGFPVDILLYNLLAPLAIQFFRPSKGLRNLYNWWFRRCAKTLRLSNFLFGHNCKQFSANVAQSEIGEDGRYVRVPASDQVRIAKGTRVFLEVNRDNERLDGQEDSENGPHGRSNPHYTKVWIPPWFRLRTAAFVFFVWALTAFIGVSVTLLPLIIGRFALFTLLPNKAPINDVYSFSIGSCLIATTIYGVHKLRPVMKSMRTSHYIGSPLASEVGKSVKAFAIRALRVLYTYSALCIYIPTLIALLIETYFIMPLHTYVSMGQAPTTNKSTTSNPSTPHAMSFLQDCTLGLLYLRVFLRLILWNQNTRPARALHALVSAGWLNPNAKIATKCFVLPFTIFTLSALITPPSLGFMAYKATPVILSALAQFHWLNALSSNLVHYLSSVDTRFLMIHLVRFSYPALLFIILTAWIFWALGKAAGRWRSKIKDEVYLIGERLHNFGERRPPNTHSTLVAKDE